MSGRTITEVVDALSQRKIQAALQSLEAVCADCPEHLCADDPRACPVSDARRSLALVFFEDWVDEEPAAPAETTAGGCSSGGCSSGGCGVKF